MNMITCNTSEEAAQVAAQLVIDRVNAKPDAILGLPTGGTPLGMYAALAKAVREKRVDLSAVTTFNLDEYCGLPVSHPESYLTFMTRNFYAPCGLAAAQTHIPDGEAADPDAEALAYDNAIRAIGGIDLQVLGIGHNGHIGFNEPGTPPDARTHSVLLTEQTRRANARFFASLDEVPTRAITMGIATILEARELLLLANGADKADILAAALRGPVTPDNPASFLQGHPRLTVIADRAAGARIVS
ncbi:MAG: glucosamine-6-phosphate deaminase [Kiritimatiellaeota bacterium]|nr:glucosamine-6-phosphate deaminase [Kiritimatiellota bacterium]